MLVRLAAFNSFKHFRPKSSGYTLATHCKKFQRKNSKWRLAAIPRPASPGRHAPPHGVRSAVRALNHQLGGRQLSWAPEHGDASDAGSSWNPPWNFNSPRQNDQTKPAQHTYHADLMSSVEMCLPHCSRMSRKVRSRDSPPSKHINLSDPNQESPACSFESLCNLCLVVLTWLVHLSVIWLNIVTCELLSFERETEREVKNKLAGS